MRRTVKVVAISTVVLSVVLLMAYLVRPHGRVSLVMDSQRLPHDATIPLPLGEYTITLVTRNHGLPLKNARIVFAVQQYRLAQNSTRAYELWTHTSATDELGVYGFAWNESRIGSFSRRVYSVTIKVSQPCVLTIVGALHHPWIIDYGGPVNLVESKRMLQLEFS